MSVEGQCGASEASDFRLLADNIPALCWMADRDGFIFWYNRRWHEYCGTTDEEMEGWGWQSVHDPAMLPNVLEQWHACIADGAPFELTLPLRGADGTFRPFLTRAVPFRNTRGEITRWFGKNTDVSELVAAEAARRESELRLRELNETLEQRINEAVQERAHAEEQLRQAQKMEAVGQLTGGLAHDFNNLLAGILGSLAMMRSRIAKERFEDLGRYMDAAEGAATRAASLTHRLLAFSRRQTLDPKPVELNGLVSGMVDLVRRTVGPAITVEVVAEPGLWTTLIDPGQLENALLNLCINARDAMPEGGLIRVETANCQLDAKGAAERDLPPGDYVSLSVTDTGAGMTPEVAARAFDPFFTTKPIGSGTGLGLSMVYGFARQSGGQAAIASVPGCGVTVCLFLPRHEGVADGQMLVGSPAPAPARAVRNRTVLVVDDEPSVRMLVKDVIEDMDCVAIEAGDGVDGMRLLREQKVDMLITDIGLPNGMNGRQLADAGRELIPGLQVLLITGFAEAAVLGDVPLPTGMQLLSKPFAIEALENAIRVGV